MILTILILYKESQNIKYMRNIYTRNIYVKPRYKFNKGQTKYHR